MQRPSIQQFFPSCTISWYILVMKLASVRIQELAKARGLTVSALLQRAGVSRNAYYSLARRESVLPKSLVALARSLGLPESELLEEIPESVVVARRICRENPEAAFENVWHALSLMKLNPIERLNRSLIRGRATTVYR